MLSNSEFPASNMAHSLHVLTCEQAGADLASRNHRQNIRSYRSRLLIVQWTGLVDSWTLFSIFYHRKPRKAVLSEYKVVKQLTIN